VSTTGTFQIDERVLQHIRKGLDYACEVYEAEQTEVVLGRAARAEDDVFVQKCAQDNVPVHKRAGGGGTVVLCAGVIIISVAGRTTLSYHLKEHMNAVNKVIIKILESLGIKGLAIKGISDITIRDKKILGSSLHRKKDLVLYQGSLLVDPSLDIITGYLRHPKKEPDYRNGRPHRDFITSLYLEGYRLNKSKLIETLKKKLVGQCPWSPCEEEDRFPSHFPI